MANQAQQMPIILNVGNIAALTEKEAHEIMQKITLGTILDVHFVDDDAEMMVPVGFVPEKFDANGDKTADAIVTVVKNGSVVKADVAPIIYDFTSYGEGGTVELATGEIVLTGNRADIDGDEYIEIKVTENTFEWAIGHLYLVTADAEPDGTTKYPIYEIDGTDTGMQVVINEHS